MNPHLVEARALLRAGRFHEAGEACRRALRANDDVAIAVRMLAVCHYNLGVMNLRDGAPLDDVEAEFRHARSCHNHLAGRSGVVLLEDLLARGWVVQERKAYVLTDLGHLELTRRGFALRPAMKGLGCTDARVSSRRH